MALEDSVEFCTLLQAAQKRLPEMKLIVCSTINAAKAALEQLEKTPPQLILLDLSLSCERGTEFVQFLKGSNKYHHIPAVVLSTSDMDKDIIECFGHGADAYVTKPATFLHLVSAIKYLTEPEAKADEFDGLSDYIQYDFTYSRNFISPRIKPAFPSA